MIEKWLVSEDPIEMMSCITQTFGRFVSPHRPSDRKFRLFACACCRASAWHRNTMKLLSAIEEAEVYAEGLTPRPFDKYKHPQGVWWTVCDDPEDGARSWAEAEQPGSWGTKTSATLLREILGNPFRPVTLDCAQLTPDVQAIARGAYEERVMPSGELDVARLAVLADALEETGCADETILSHLRSPGPHARGCWVMDLILGKS